MRRRTFLGLVATAGCDVARQPDTHGPLTSSGSPADPTSRRITVSAYQRLCERIERERKSLAGELDRTPRGKLLTRARATVRSVISDQLFPAWLGTRWDFNGTATHPHDEHGIACGYFVATILMHAGLRLSSRARYGQAGALAIQKALTPDPSQLHRIFSVPAADLSERIQALGEGLYLIGLNIHVGFVVVEAQQVRLVHASYTGGRVVTDEPLVAAEAIAASRKAGYFVTPLFRDERLVTAWLEATTVPAPSRPS